VNRVLILGANGMLGATLVKWFASLPDYAVTATTRSGKAPSQLEAVASRVAWVALDADTVGLPELSELCGRHQTVINAIGKIKQRIHEESLADWEGSIRANALFSVLLAQAAEATGAQIIQIATDCVYTGAKGAYSEDDEHDPQDLYGKSKSMGEVVTKNVVLLRCSMVGPELASSFSLLSWFLSQPKGARLSGYTNHFWNGLTALHFAKICQGLVEQPRSFPRVMHLVPADTVSKYDILRLFKEAFGRDDIEIEPTQTATGIDRTLVTLYPEANLGLWQSAGYDKPPTVEDMIRELAQYEQ